MLRHGDGFSIGMLQARSGAVRTMWTVYQLCAAFHVARSLVHHHTNKCTRNRTHHAMYSCVGLSVAGSDEIEGVTECRCYSTRRHMSQIWSVEADIDVWRQLGHLPRTAAGNLKRNRYVRSLLAKLAQQYNGTIGAIISRFKRLSDSSHAAYLPSCDTPPRARRDLR